MLVSRLPPVSLGRSAIVARVPSIQMLPVPVCKSLDAGLFYLASLLAVPPRDEAVVECGGGGQHVVGVGRHEGGREGGGVVREEVSRVGERGSLTRG